MVKPAAAPPVKGKELKRKRLPGGLLLFVLFTLYSAEGAALQLAQRAASLHPCEFA
jgi:hypothetical protein